MPASKFEIVMARLRRRAFDHDSEFWDGVMRRAYRRAKATRAAQEYFQRNRDAADYRRARSLERMGF